jgi:phosphonate transport system substrate-binding protein
MFGLQNCRKLYLYGLIFTGLFSFNLLACSTAGAPPTLVIAGIPDQNISLLEARFDGLASYLTEETGINTEYIPSIDYAAVVTGFKQGDIHLAWYGGLTGVQARLAAQNAHAIAQRPRDADFHSVFVGNPDLKMKSLADVKGKSLTFGSESSTSGHLMPRYYLMASNVDPSADLEGPANYSGSHDKTWKLVETGAFDVGALNEAVWEKRISEGRVDLTKVTMFHRSPAYYDYHWVMQSNIDEHFGPGSSEKIKDALLSLDASQSEMEKRILESFQTEKFIGTNDTNYTAIEEIAKSLGIIVP